MAELYNELPAGSMVYVKRPIKVKAVQMKTEFSVKGREGLASGRKGDYILQALGVDQDEDNGGLQVMQKKLFESAYVQGDVQPCSDNDRVVAMLRGILQKKGDVNKGIPEVLEGIIKQNETLKAENRELKAKK